MVTYSDIVPYMCFYIDADWSDFCEAARLCILGSSSTRDDLLTQITRLWMTSHNRNPVVVTLSVRTAFDLYLQVMNFKPGSEIIMSAVNIPDIATILHHHKLKVVALDINVATTEPKLDLLEPLITERTVAILVAHIYGKWVTMEPIVNIAEKYGIKIIEDCAEGFHGFEMLGHTKTDISLFSFGTIKTQTAFGGSVAKVKDHRVHHQMLERYKSYPIQTHRQYLHKVLKCSLIYVFMRHQLITKCGMYLLRLLGLDHKPYTVKLMRGFPDQLIQRIRTQPSDALVNMLQKRFHTYHSSHEYETCAKVQYVYNRIRHCVQVVGSESHLKYYWLFPIVVRDPDRFHSLLNDLGIDSYRGATQLNVVEPDSDTDDCTCCDSPGAHAYSRDCARDCARACAAPVDDNHNGNVVESQCKNSKSLEKNTVQTSLHRAACDSTNVITSSDTKYNAETASKASKQRPTCYPHEARSMIDHIVYLPVHKNVPYSELDKICKVVQQAVAICDGVPLPAKL